MDKCEIDELDVSTEIKEAAKTAKLVSFKEILMLSSREIGIKASLTEEKSNALLYSVSNAYLKTKRVVTAYDIHKNKLPPEFIRQKVSLGCPILDSTLNGGISTKTVTEIAGQSSSGKTQLCLQLAIQSQLPIEYGGLNTEVAYVCTEEKFPLKRYKQMVHILQSRHEPLNKINFCDQILINNIRNVDQMMAVLEKCLPELLKRKIKIFIIDSIAGLFRGQYEDYEHVQRTQDLEKVAIEIWKLANEHGMAVVCVNQLSASVENNDNDIQSVQEDKPALGLTWANVLTNRIMLSRTNHLISVGELQTPSAVRRLQVVFSPYLSNNSCHYTVTEKGISGVKNPLSVDSSS